MPSSYGCLLQQPLGDFVCWQDQVVQRAAVHPSVGCATSSQPIVVPDDVVGPAIGIDE